MESGLCTKTDLETKYLPKLNSFRESFDAAKLSINNSNHTENDLLKKGMVVKLSFFLSLSLFLKFPFVRIIFTSDNFPIINRHPNFSYLRLEIALLELKLNACGM